MPTMSSHSGGEESWSSSRGWSLACRGGRTRRWRVIDYPLSSLSHRSRSSRTSPDGPLVPWVPARTFTMRKAEARLNGALHELSQDGYSVLHDLDVGFARVSHCVVGPTGVFAIEPEGRAEVAKVVGEANRLERLLHAAGVEQEV